MKVLPTTGATEREVSQAIKDLTEGRSNANGTVTLTANTTTTTVTKSTINANAGVWLEPRTANASAERGNGTIYTNVAAAGGSFVITHANNAQTDRTFYYLVNGG